MSDLQAIYIFLRKAVSGDMIHFLVATTNSVIAVPKSSASLSTSNNYYASPPTTPTEECKSLQLQQQPEVPDLYTFIERLVVYTHVQTSTLMSSLVYLTRLRSILPPNSTGMETTRHRIFLGCLILAAKNLNDTSPMNKHWAQYTDGLLTLQDVNVLEMELIEYLGWDNLRIRDEDIICSFSSFLEPIKKKLRYQNEAKLSTSNKEHITKAISSRSIYSRSSSSTSTQPLFASTSSPSFPVSKQSYYPSPPLRQPPTSRRVTDQQSINTMYQSQCSPLQSHPSRQQTPTPSSSTSSVPSLISTSTSTSSIQSSLSSITTPRYYPHHHQNTNNSLNNISINNLNQHHQKDGNSSDLNYKFKPKPLRLLSFKNINANLKENESGSNITSNQYYAQQPPINASIPLRVVNDGY